MSKKKITSKKNKSRNKKAVKRKEEEEPKLPLEVDPTENEEEEPKLPLAVESDDRVEADEGDEPPEYEYTTSTLERKKEEALKRIENRVGELVDLNFADANPEDFLSLEQIERAHSQGMEYALKYLLKLMREWRRDTSPDKLVKFEAYLRKLIEIRKVLKG